jgi:hypothetical protein
MSRHERTGREVDAWMVLIHAVPEAASSPLPRRKSACVVHFSFVAMRFSTAARPADRLSPT